MVIANSLQALQIRGVEALVGTGNLSAKCDDG